ncbi:hypothetical protein [Cryptosporangium phraense]|uniref:Uncharacterized protein n=1 Tax=Cryptosporangium phraense TaxID=2593070 RepID=A0A545AK40_9ACTN|nr:hypothetical protein [Cryptosporangium phraense]TQS41697.1 hypothetical protein FL583_28055 [Cryptosporangium phraense]
MRYAPVPLPVERAARPDPDAILAGIDRWTASEPLHDLVRAFGGSLPDGSLDERLTFLEAFSLERWDSRKGGERWEAVRPDFAPHIDEVIRATSTALGLSLRAEPARGEYTHLLVLGGGVRTCVIRAEFAARIVDGGVRVRDVAGLGSFRPTRDDEKAQAARLGGYPCRSEHAAMDLALRLAFDLPPGSGVDEAHGVPSDPGDEVPMDAWLIRRYSSGDVPVQVLAAPSSEPSVRRANTADTLTFWGRQIVGLSPDDSVLIATSDVHVPFQHADAVRTLGLRFGCGVDTVGVDTGKASIDWVAYTNDESQILQEVRSAVRSMALLRASLVTSA